VRPAFPVARPWRFSEPFGFLRGAQAPLATQATMEEIFNNLNIDWRILLCNFVGFGLLWLTANKLVFVPIGKVIEERQADVQKTYDQLDDDQRQMQTLKTEYEQRLAAVEAEGRERINSMIKEAQASRDQVLSDANGRAHELISRAELEVARDKEQAMITLRQQVAELAIGAAERVIGENLDSDRSRRLVDEFITSGGGDAPDYSAKAEAKRAATTATAAVVAGAVAVGAAVAAGVNALKDAAEDVAQNVADAVEDATSPAKKPRVVRKPKTTEEGGAA